MTIARTQTSSIENVDDFSVVMRIEQAVNGFDHLRSGPRKHAERQWQRQFKRLYRATLEADFSEHRSVFLKSDVFQQQMRHPLPLPMRQVWIIPNAGKICGERQDLLSLGLLETDSCILLLLFVLFLSRMQSPQPAVPVRFQLIGDQSIIGIDSQVPAACKLCLLLCPLYNLVPEPIGLLKADFHFPFDRKRYLQIQRVDRGQQELADSPVKIASGNPLALLLSIVRGDGATDVIGVQMPAPLVILNLHPPTTSSTDGQALKQGRAFTGWSAFVLRSILRRVLLQFLLIGLILLPADVPGVCVWNERVPLLRLDLLLSPLDNSVGQFHRPRPPEPVSAGIARARQDPCDPVVGQIIPDDFSTVRTAPHAMRKLQAFLSECFYDRKRRTGASKRSEQVKKTLLHLPIRVQFHSARIAVNQPCRKPATQFPTPGFLEKTAAKACTDQVQLNFAHRPLEAQ